MHADRQPNSSRTALPEWKAVADHAAATSHLTLREIFAADHGRAARFTFEACGLVVDHAKQRITEASLPLLVHLAWAYVALRIVHSLIHLSYNHVLHRFLAFATSNVVLLGIWALLVQAVLLA